MAISTDQNTGEALHALGDFTQFYSTGTLRCDNIEEYHPSYNLKVGDTFVLTEEMAMAKLRSEYNQRVDDYIDKVFTVEATAHGYYNAKCDGLMGCYSFVYEVVDNHLGKAKKISDIISITKYTLTIDSAEYTIGEVEEIIEMFTKAKKAYKKKYK